MVLLLSLFFHAEDVLSVLLFFLCYAIKAHTLKTFGIIILLLFIYYRNQRWCIVVSKYIQIRLIIFAIQGHMSSPETDKTSQQQSTTVCESHSTLLALEYDEPSKLQDHKTDNTCHHHHHGIITPTSSISLLWKQLPIIITANHNTNEHTPTTTSASINNSNTSASLFFVPAQTNSSSPSTTHHKQQLKTKRNRIVTKVIQHPTTFYNFHAFCKHLSEVWEMDLVRQYKEYVKTKHLDTHPAIVSAFIAYTHKLPPIESKCFIFDVWNDILRSWEKLPPICHVIVWSRLQEIIDLYYRHRLNYVLVQSVLAPFIPTNHMFQRKCRAFVYEGNKDGTTKHSADTEASSSVTSPLLTVLQIGQPQHQEHAEDTSSDEDNNNDNSADDNNILSRATQAMQQQHHANACQYYSPVTTFDSFQSVLDAVLL